MKRILLTLFILLIFISCNNDEPSSNTEVKYGTFFDVRDGHTYKTVKIGEQTWLAENLAYLPQVDNTLSLTESRYYVYDYSGTNVSMAKSLNNYLTYGVLYNFYAALEAIPSGWHLPTMEEWNTLVDYLGGDDIAGGKMKSILGWKSPNINATNSSGFSALPGGAVWYLSFQEIFISAGWWSSTLSDFPGNVLGKDMCNCDGKLTCFDVGKDTGFSVRCIKN